MNIDLDIPRVAGSKFKFSELISSMYRIYIYILVTIILKIDKSAGSTETSHSFGPILIKDPITLLMWSTLIEPVGSRSD